MAWTDAARKASAEARKHHVIHKGKRHEVLGHSYLGRSDMFKLKSRNSGGAPFGALKSSTTSGIGKGLTAYQKKVMKAAALHLLTKKR